MPTFSSIHREVASTLLRRSSGHDSTMYRVPYREWMIMPMMVSPDLGECGIEENRQISTTSLSKIAPSECRSLEPSWLSTYCYSDAVPNQTYLIRITLGSIHNAAGTMVLLCFFISVPRAFRMKKIDVDDLLWALSASIRATISLVCYYSQRLPTVPYLGCH